MYSDKGRHQSLLFIGPLAAGLNKSVLSWETRPITMLNARSDWSEALKLRIDHILLDVSDFQ